MSNFKYQAIDIDKKLVEGSIEASSLKDARQKICEMGLLPTKISTDMPQTPVKFDVDESKLSNLSLKLQSKLLFVSELQTMLSSGLSVLEALNVLCRHTREDINLRYFVLSLQSSILAGATLTEAIKPFKNTLGNVLVGLISAGEGAGKLVTTLERARILLKKEQKIKSYIIRVSIYPSIMFLLAFILLLFFGLFAIPRLKSLPSTGEIPGLAEKIISIPIFLISHWFPVLLFTFATIGLLYFIFSNQTIKRKIDSILLDIPKIRDFVRYINLSNYFAVLSETYNSDIPIPEAFLYSAASIKNVIMRENAAKLEAYAAKGMSITESIVLFDYVDESFVTSIAAGEKSGELTEKFEEISRVIDEKIDGIVETLLQLYGPITILLVGVVVAIVAVAFWQSYFAIILGL